MGPVAPWEEPGRSLEPLPEDVGINEWISAQDSIRLFENEAIALAYGPPGPAPARRHSSPSGVRHSHRIRLRAAVARTLLDRPSLLVVCGDEQGGAFSPPGVGPGNRPLESPRTLR